MKALRLVVRGDLPPGLQLAQACHAARLFAADHPVAEQTWYQESNTLAVLTVPDRAALVAIHDQAGRLGLRVSLFREPDLGDEPTAMAIEPGAFARRLCQGLPLALSVC